MAPVAIVPRIHYAHAPYMTRRHSEVAPGWPAQDHFLKVHLAFLLNSCQLANKPYRFPFPNQYQPYQPYEFQEQLAIQNFAPGQAIIRFNGHNPYEGYLTWQVLLSGPSYSSRNSRGRSPEVARVQVNVDVSKSFFWQDLVSDPSTILRALAISLEIGKPLSIEILDANTVVYQTLGSRGKQNYLVVKRS